MSLLPWQTAVIKAVIQQTPNTKSFILETKELESFSFIPGQFVTLELPIHDRPSQRLRSYSIASAPGHNTFELLISHKEGGLGTTYLFHDGEPGHEIRFRGPLGTFVFPDHLDRDICLICTGTGIAPFRSQLKYMAMHKFPEREFHLVFGARYKTDILYYEELVALKKEHPNFHYHVALSRETDPNWEGYRGYVHAVYEQICGNGKKEMDFYLCGWRNMIDEARKRIAEMGYLRERVHLESYD